MPRYIDAEKQEKDGWWASRAYQQDTTTNVYETKKLTDFPIADVRENIHANWLREEYFGGIFKCSNCGKYVDFRGLKGTQDPANFCPNCGADMREERVNK